MSYLLNKHVVDLRATAVPDVVKPERRVKSVLSKKQNVKNENILSTKK